MHCSFLRDYQGPIMCGVDASNRVLPADCVLRNGIRIHRNVVNAVSKTPPHGIMDTLAFTGATAITVAEHEHSATACKRFAGLRFVHESDQKVGRELLSYSTAKSSRLVSVARNPSDSCRSAPTPCFRGRISVAVGKKCSVSRSTPVRRLYRKIKYRTLASNQGAVFIVERFSYTPW